MDSSVRLFSVRGIDIKVHVTFPLILVWAAIQFGLLSGRGLQGAAFGVVVTLLLFAIVLLHELGHSFVALEYDVPIRQIVLLPIGGVAQMGRIPDKPIQEFLVAIAGPGVNFVLAILMVGAAVLFGVDLGLQMGADFGLTQIARGLQGFGWVPVFRYVFVTNLFLAIFNLLPAFPMDGGRVLRALLASRIDYARATAIAVTIGQILAAMMGLAGFLSGNFFLILIAIFIYMGASQEGQLTQVRNVLAGLTVAHAYSRQAIILAPDDPLRRAVDATLSSFQANFPVCDGEQLVGILTQQRLLEAQQGDDGQMPIRQVMQRQFTHVAPEDGLFEVQQKLRESQMEALPVSVGDRFLGLITQQDIAEIYKLASSQPEAVGRPVRPEERA